MYNGRGLAFNNPNHISCVCPKHHVTHSWLLTPSKKKKKCIIQDWCSLSLKSAQASLYIVRDGRKSWGLLWESFQLSVWLIFPAGSLCHTEKVKAWEKTYKELLKKKNIWLRYFTGLLQLPLSQLMTLDNKCISNKYPEGSLEFLCVGVDMWGYVYMYVKVVMYI